MLPLSLASVSYQKGGVVAGKVEKFWGKAWKNLNKTKKAKTSEDMTELNSFSSFRLLFYLLCYKTETSFYFSPLSSLN